MKFAIVCCVILCAYTVLAQLEFNMGVVRMMMMQQKMTMMQQRCNQCGMCDMAFKYCGICDDGNTRGFCKHCQNIYYCYTTCITMCGYQLTYA